MTVETIKMSSKGQIVIPQNIREAIGAEEGTVFAVTNAEDALFLKKISVPSKDELIKNLKRIAKAGKTRLVKKGFTESDLHAR